MNLIIIHLVSKYYSIRPKIESRKEMQNIFVHSLIYKYIHFQAMRMKKLVFQFRGMVFHPHHHLTTTLKLVNYCSKISTTRAR